MMSWFFYSIFALVTFVAYDLLSRKLAVNSLNPRAFGALYNGLVALLTLFLLFVEPIHLKPLAAGILILTFANLAVWTLFGRVEYYAHKFVEASTLSLILRLAPVITFVLSALFLHEAVTISKILALTLILTANFWLILITQKGKFHFDEGLKYAFITAITLGFGWTLDKVVSPYYGVTLFAFLSFASPSLSNFLIPPLSAKVIRLEYQNTPLGKIALLAALNLVGYAALIKALMLGEASKVVPIATATTPFVVILGIILLKETSFIKVKLVAAFLTLAAIFLLR